MIKKSVENLKKISLTEEEKSRMRSSLLAYARVSPVRADNKDRLIPQRSKIFALISTLKERRYVMPAMILALIITLSGGTAFAADGALPGDALYPLKIGVNEKVRAALSFSEEAKAELAIELAEERLREMERLANRGRLRAEVISQLENNFSEFEERVEVRIEDFRAQGREDLAARIASRLETALDAHAQVLERLSVKVGDEAGDETDQAETDETDRGADIEARVKVETMLDALVGTLKERTEAAGEARARAEAEAVAEVEADADREGTVSGAKNRAEAKVSQATAQLLRSENKLSAEASARAEAKLDSARQSVIEADAKARDGLFAAALRLYYQAITFAEEVMQSIRAQTDFQIDLRFGGRAEAGVDGDREPGDARSRAGAEAEIDLEADSAGEPEDKNVLPELDSQIRGDSSVRLRLGN